MKTRKVWKDVIIIEENTDSMILAFSQIRFKPQFYHYAESYEFSHYSRKLLCSMIRQALA